MTPRSTAVNQVRRRKRPIPSVPPEPPRPDVTAPRYYCPACGMVRPSAGVWEVEGNDGEFSPAVRRHYISRPGPWSDNEEIPVGESLERDICPGGPIDLIADRAP